jgi:long-chain acyl-CoA synthetase
MRKKAWLSAYPDSVAKEIDIPDITIPQVLQKIANNYPGHNAITFYTKKITLLTMAYCLLARLLHR